MKLRIIRILRRFSTTGMVTVMRLHTDIDYFLPSSKIILPAWRHLPVALLISIILFPISGCSTIEYPGYDLSPDDVAVLDLGGGFSRDAVAVVAIDGQVPIENKSTLFGTQRYKRAIEDSMKLTPGHHSVTFLPRNVMIPVGMTADPITKDITVEAGRKYRVRANLSWDSSATTMSGSGYTSHSEGTWRVEITKM